MPITGVAHVSLTVRNLRQSETWYCNVLGFERAEEVHEAHFDSVVLRHPDTPLALSLRQHHGASTARFDETRTGLDHVAFAVDDRSDLEAWAVRLQELKVEHSPLVDLDWGSVIVLRDPDHIQLELSCPPAPAD